MPVGGIIEIIPYQELLWNYDKPGKQHLRDWIIPYQELLGNYDVLFGVFAVAVIIPYQELLGNYDWGVVMVQSGSIIPYQELLGNYDKEAREPCLVDIIPLILCQEKVQIKNDFFPSCQHT